MLVSFADSRLPDKFWSKVAPCPMSGCWLWTAAVDRSGYGKTAIRAPLHSNALAHRVAYAALLGPIPDGLSIDHRCSTRCCVNPAHLEPVSHVENVRRGRAGKPYASRMACKAGHEYSESNTRIVKSKNGGRARQCIACMIDRRRRQ